MTDTTTRSRTISIDGAALHVLEAGPRTGGGLLLLHGAWFRADTWKELGTIERAAEAGLRVVALDLPGYGDSEPLAPSEPPALGPVELLSAVLECLEMEPVVLVAPSMSGAFAFPFVAAQGERVAGFVPIAPVGMDEFPGPSEVPALVIWGENDQVLPPDRASRLAECFSEAKTVILSEARHPCYLDRPDRFHEELIEFAVRVLAP